MGPSGSVCPGLWVGQFSCSSNVRWELSAVFTSATRPEGVPEGTGGVLGDKGTEVVTGKELEEAAGGQGTAYLKARTEGTAWREGTGVSGAGATGS